MVRARSLGTLASALILCASTGCGATSQAASHGSPGPDLVANGDFETPVIGQAWILIPNGDTSLPGWTVSGDGVEIMRTYWQPASGKQSINLSSNGRSSAVAQKLKTSSGTAYEVRWFQSANPQCLTPTVRGVDVLWDGQVVATPTFDVNGHSFQSMGWKAESVIVHATGSESNVGFQRAAATDGTCGIAIDDVSVRQS